MIPASFDHPAVGIRPTIDGRLGGVRESLEGQTMAMARSVQRDADGRPTMKPYWEITDEEVEACLKATTWHPSITEYFPAGGWSTRYRTRGGMPATMVRLNLAAGLGPCLQVAEGWTIELPEAIHDALDQSTNPTWPTDFPAAIQA